MRPRQEGLSPRLNSSLRLLGSPVRFLPGPLKGWLAAKVDLADRSIKDSAPDAEKTPGYNAKLANIKAKIGAFARIVDIFVRIKFCSSSERCWLVNCGLVCNPLHPITNRQQNKFKILFPII